MPYASSPAMLCRAVVAIALTVCSAASLGASPLQEVQALQRRGDNAAAMRRLEAALAADPADAGLRFQHALMLHAAGRGPEAEAAYERMTQDFPDQPEPFNNLAVIRAAAGQLDDAQRLLDAALRLDPGYRDAQRNLGDVLLQLAQRTYERAAAGATPDAPLSRRLQWLRGLNPSPAR